MSTEDQSRSEFEAWMVDEGYGAKPRICSAGSPCEGEYANQYWHRSWISWQASRRNYRASVLEEAAQAVESMRDLKEAKDANDRANAAFERGDDRDSLARLRHHSQVSLFNGALERAARAIRALAGKVKGE